MNIARLNFSHGTHEYHQQNIEYIRQAAKETNRNVALMLDIKGPKIRTGKFKTESVTLEPGNKFIFTNDQSCIGDETIVSVSYKELPLNVEPGRIILVDDGNLQFKVEETDGTYIHTTVLIGGTLSDRKGVNVPGADLTHLPVVSDKDINDILFGVQNDIDFIAASFINRASDIELIRNIPGVKEGNIKIVAKIETQLGIDNFKEILSVSDGIMVARGDLGVEIPIEKICNVQKMIIKECNIAGKPVITATQMLESMIKNPRPTRAEVADVSNAVYDGTDCVMLSAESAVGKFVVESVVMMKKICRETEKTLAYRNIYTSLRNMEHQMKEWSKLTSITDSVASSAVKTSWDLNASLIIALTESGQTSRLVSKYRPHVAILCVTPHAKIARQSLISRGIIPFIIDEESGGGKPLNNEFEIERAIIWAKERDIVLEGEIVVIIAGVVQGVPGSTNMMRVDVVK